MDVIPIDKSVSSHPRPALRCHTVPHLCPIHHPISNWRSTKALWTLLPSLIFSFIIVILFSWKVYAARGCVRCIRLLASELHSLNRKVRLLFSWRSPSRCTLPILFHFLWLLFHCRCLFSRVHISHVHQHDIITTLLRLHPCHGNFESMLKLGGCAIPLTHLHFNHRIEEIKNHAVFHKFTAVIFP